MSGTTEDRLEELLGEVLVRPRAEQQETLAATCTEHPEYADQLRRRFAALHQIGFAGTSTTQSLRPGTQFGRYKFLEEIGRGGMGIVYLAEQKDLGRKVALKLLRPGLLDVERARQRFQREIEAASRVEHPGICPLYEAGEVDGVPFLAMRYVQGCTLAEHLDDRRQADRASEIAATLALVEKVARALAAAHAAGLVHRDVKPGNIQLAENGDPVLLDFGLARALESQGPSLTLSSDVLGTPAYLAPEQIDGKHPIGPHADVFALGVVLYECLTLQLPFHGRTRDSLYRAILTQEPAKATTVNHSVPADLQVVLEVALDKDPARRYPDAGALAEDLARVRRHEPIRARRISSWLRARRWCQRNPYATTAMGVLAAGLLAAGLLAGFWKSALVESNANLSANLAWRKLDQEPAAALQKALEAVDRFPTAENLATLRAVLHRPLPVAEYDPGDNSFSGFDIARDGSAAAWVTGQGNLHVLRDGVFRHVAELPTGGWDLRFSPNGRELLITASIVARVVTLDGEVLRKLRPPGTEGLSRDEAAGLYEVQAADWHPTRDLALLSAYFKESQLTRIYLFDTRTWKPLRELLDPEQKMPGPMRSAIRFSADGAFIVAANAWSDAFRNLPHRYETRVWSLEGKFMFRHSEHVRNIHALALHEHFLLTGGGDQRVVLTDLSTQRVVALDVPSEVSSVGFLPDGTVWAAGWDGYVRLFDRDLRRLESFTLAQGQRVNGVVRVGNDLVVAVRDVGRFLVDRAGKQISRLPAPPSQGLIGYPHDGPLGDLFLTFGFGEPARLWRWTAPGLRRFSWPDLAHPGARLSDGGGGVFAFTRRNDIGVWNAEGRREWQQPSGLSSMDVGGICAATPDHHTVVVCEDPGKVHIYDTSANTEQVVDLGDALFYEVNIDPAGRWILTRSPDPYRGWCVIRRGADNQWAAGPRGQLGRRFPAHVRFRPGPPGDTVELAVGGYGCGLYSTDGRSFTPLRTLVAGELTVPAFSQDGRWLAVACTTRGSVRVHDLKRSSSAPIEITHGPGLSHVSIWSGDRLVTTSNDEVRLWSREGEFLALLRTPRHVGFREAVLSENGDRILTLYQDLVVETWFANNDDVVDTAREILGK